MKIKIKQASLEQLSAILAQERKRGELVSARINDLRGKSGVTTAELSACIQVATREIKSRQRLDRAVVRRMKMFTGSATLLDFIQGLWDNVVVDLRTPDGAEVVWNRFLSEIISERLDDGRSGA